MKVIFDNCCGIDVHKRFLIATIVKSSNDVQPSYSRKRFSTFNSNLIELRDWLTSHDCFDVCMESTGKYWIPVSNILEATHRLTIANPKWVKAIKGNKDDKKDSKWIADLFRFGLVPSSFIPDKSIRTLREFTRYRSRLISMRSSEKNRFQNALTSSNIALDSVVSDIFGVSSTKIIDYIISNDDYNLHSFIDTLHASMKKKADLIIDSIENNTLSAQQIVKINIIKQSMASINSSIQTCEDMIDTLILPYQPHIDLLCTNFGIQYRCATIILSEIGIDMSQFKSSKRLCCWAGLTPSNNESAGKKKSVRISKAGVYLKPALVQAAHAAIKSTKNPYYRIKYEKIAKRRGKKRAIIAIARMMLTAIFHMLSTGEVFNPRDLDRVLNPEELITRQKTNRAILLLEQQGYCITKS